MEKFNMDEVATTKKEYGYTGPEGGGYVATITGVTDNKNKQYLAIDLDIAEGTYKGYYTDLFQRANFWGLTSYRSYKPRARGFFKAFIEAVETSNDGYQWDWNEDDLINLNVGIVIGLEDYIGNDGRIKTRPKVVGFHSVADIKDGNFAAPEHTKIKEQPVSAGVVDATEETPF